MNLHLHLQPSEFIALTNLGNPQRIATYNMVPGTVVRLRNGIFVLVDAPKGPHQWIHATNRPRPGYTKTPPPAHSLSASLLSAYES